MGATRAEARGLRRRMASGARAQVFDNLVRVLVQIGGIGILLPVWGIHRYGEWLVLSSVPTYLAFSDLGFFAAANYDMVMAVARGERDLAGDVFRAVTRGVALSFAALLVILPAIAFTLPTAEWLNLDSMAQSTVSIALVLLGLDVLLVASAGLLYGGFASAGRYGQGAFWLAGMVLAEFVAVVLAVVLTENAAVAAAGMFGTRLLLTAGMYWRMRKRAPWLAFGRPRGRPEVIKRLTRPALASAAFPTGLAFNIQGTVVLIGVAGSPAQAAVFVTLRTVSRVVIQMLNSIGVILSPEFARAYASGDQALLTRLHRRGCQASLWVSLPIVAVLAVAGTTLIDVWTGGRITGHSGLLLLLLGVSAIDSLWYTSLAVLYSTNRHVRIGQVFIAGCAAALPLTYVMFDRWGLNGAGGALVALEAFMLVAVLRESLPAAGDRLWPWLRAVLTPPRPSALAALRSPDAGGGRRRSTRGGDIARGITVGLAAMGIGAGLGVAAATASGHAALFLEALAAGALALLLLRRAVAVRAGRARDGDAGSDWSLTAARALFFAATATVALPSIARVGGLTISEILFILAFGAAVFEALRGTPVGQLPAGVLIGTFVFALGGALSSRHALDSGASLTQTMHGVYVMLLWAWTGTMVLRTERDFKITIVLWSASAAFSSLGALAQLAGVHTLVQPVVGGRMTGFTDHPNDLGGMCAVALVPALALASGMFSSGRRWLGAAALLPPLLIATGLILAGSVAGMAAGMVAVLLWLSSPMVRNSARVAVAGIVVLALAVATAIGGGISPTERLSQVTSSSTEVSGGGSGDERLEIARVTWPAIKADPIVGVGMDTRSATVYIVSVKGTSDPYLTHGLPLAAWYEGGIFALIGVVLVFLELFRAIAASRNNGDQTIGWALSSALVASLVYLLSAPLVYQQYAWLAAVTLLAWRALWARQPAPAAPTVVRGRAPAMAPGRSFG